MMGTANFIGRIGALALALGVGNVRRVAIRMTVSVGVAAVVSATVVPAPGSTASPAVELSADSTALIVCGTTCPTPDAYFVETVMNQYVTPTHPGQTITPVAVTTPEEYWPITGLFRLIGLAVGDPRMFGPGGPGWPDQPWWKVSGLFDLTINQSIQAGVDDLEQAMAEHGDDHLVIYGLSQGATVANTEKRKLAEQYPAGTAAPDIDFVLQGDPNHPNGGLSSRFPGLYIPILDLTFDGPAPTDTQFDTIEINRQYDGAADFPLYPLNVIATLNALLGFVYLHTNAFDVSLPADPTTSSAYQGTHGDTSYYFFETQDLPLFAPLRMLGVPESLIDVVEPFVRVLVEVGYDRSIPPWEPTPARLIPTLNPVTVTTDLVNAIGEGINNAAALVGSPPRSVSAPVTLAAPANESAKVDLSPQVTSKEMPTRTEQAVSTGAAIDTRQVSTDTAPLTAVTEAAQTDVSPQDAPTEPVTETDQPTSAQTSSDTEQPTSPNAARASTLKPEKHRPLVRDSLRAGQQPSERSERGEGDRPTTRTVAAGAEASTGEPSSTGTSSAGSSSAGSSSDSGSSGGDGDGS